MVWDEDEAHGIMTEIGHITYRHVASAAAAVHTTAGFDVDSSETVHAGSVQPQIHLAARHPASFRPS